MQSWYPRWEKCLIIKLLPTGDDKMRFSLKHILPGYLALILILGFDKSLTSAEPDPKTFFNKEVQPILQAHCMSCHGAEKKVKGGFNLSSRDALLKGGDSGKEIGRAHV